jgi:hypothetical protein
MAHYKGRGHPTDRAIAQINRRFLGGFRSRHPRRNLGRFYVRTRKQGEDLYARLRAAGFASYWIDIRVHEGG